MIDYISDEEDVKDILRAPFSGVISDATYPSGGRVHPRVYGTFARLIEKYVMQEHVLTLEQAVHKVTGHAADLDADLLLFSPENVREHGTYARPNLPATGFDEVFVLGERVIENGVYRGDGGTAVPDVDVASGGELHVLAFDERAHSACGLSHHAVFGR